MNGIIGVADSKNGTSSLIGGEKIKMIARDEQTHIKNSKKMTENEKDIHVADLFSGFCICGDGTGKCRLPLTKFVFNKIRNIRPALNCFDNSFSKASAWA